MRRVLLGLLVLILLACLWFVHLLWLGGSFRTLSPHFAGRCRAVAGVPGPEDLTIHPGTGVAYVSSQDREAVVRGEPGRGAIFAYDLSRPDPAPVNLTPGADPDFRPHGISLLPGADGRDLLFVIDHAGGRHAIRVFEIAADALVERRTLTDPLLVSPNDLVAVGPEQVYVTNDHGRPQGLARTLEDYLRLPLANVVLWDGAGFRVAASGLRIANGIQAGPDAAAVYVAATTGREIRVYARDPESGALALREEIALDTSPDNIEVDAAGSLWVGAHPKIFDLVAYMQGRAKIAPSQVLRLRPRPEGGFLAEEVYLNAGAELSGASVAAVRGARLLVGAIREQRFLDCTMD